MPKSFNELKNKEIRVKVSEKLFNDIKEARGLIPQNTFLAYLIKKALEE